MELVDWPCATQQRMQPKEPLIQHDIPSQPWEKIGVDITLNDKYYLCSVDYYSDYFEIDNLHSKTGQAIIGIIDFLLLSVLQNYNACRTCLTVLMRDFYCEILDRDWVNLLHAQTIYRLKRFTHKDII
jgi:hypothetical protein